MFLDNIQMKKKLIGGFLCIVILALIIAIIGYISMGDMAGKAQIMYDDNLVSLDQLLTADNSFLNIRINIYKTVFAKDERVDKFAEIDQEIANIKDKVNLYRVRATSQEEQANLEKFDTNWPIFEQTLRTIISDMTAGREEAALAGIYSDDFAIPRDDAQTALDNLEAYNQEQARILKNEITHQFENSSLLFFIIGILTLVFGIGLAVILTKSITQPLSQTVHMIREMGMGHLGNRLNMSRRDEIGEMAESMDAFAENLQINVIGTIHKIAKGEKIKNVMIMDEHDEIGPALRDTVNTISHLIDETNNLVFAAQEGNLSIRGDESSFQGGYQDIIAGFNKTLENILIPLHEAMKLAKNYANGDFSSRFSSSILVKGDFISFKDAMDTIGIETGKAISAVNKEIEALQTNMEETNASSEEISSGTHVLAQNATQVSDLSDKSSQGIMQILQAMNDLASAVSSVASETTDVAGLTQKTNELSVEGTRLVERTDEGMTSIKNSFEETNLVVKEIDAQMGEIGSIVEVIGGIADQTNLLALNAAIEAARAGDAGLGFAVVANEVKTLAEESRVSAEKIGGLIDILQRKSKNVTNSMNKSLVDVESGDYAVKEMMKIFTQIADSIENASRRVSDVAANTQEQAASVEEITASVHELEKIATESSKEALSASSATEQISSSIDLVTKAITEANISIQKISTEMGKFSL